MDHLADSIAKLSQGRENWCIGREGIPVDNSSGEKCTGIIPFSCPRMFSGESCLRCRVCFVCFEGWFFERVIKNIMLVYC